MRSKSTAKLWMCTGGILLAGFAPEANAQLAVTGNLSTTAVTYGPNIPGTGALATQTLNSAFSDNTNTNGDTTGSELDAAYGVVENNYLYLFFAGNVENNGNALQIWIDDGRAGGQNVLNAATSAGSMKNMNGSTFSPGFNATYALEINATGNPSTNSPVFVDQYNLVANTATYEGTFNTTAGVGTSIGSSETAVLVGLNNTNIAGVTGSGSSTTAATAANQTNAQAVSLGYEIGIPLVTLGSPTGPIEVMAGINGNGDSGLSNQMLPGLPVGSFDVKSVPSGTITNPYYFKNAAGGVGFNFSTLSNEFFTVPNAVAPDGNWLPTGGGNWSDTTNWSNSAVPNAVGASANLTTATGASQITLDISPTVGMLNLNSTSSYTIAANAGQTLTLDNGGSSAMANINDYGGIHTISGPVVLNSNVTVFCQNHGDVMTISGNISGAGGLTVSNSGILNNVFSALVLSGNNTYSGGTSIQRGELQLDSAGALPVGTSLSINAASPHGVLDLNGFNATVSSLSATASGAAIINSNATPGTATFTYAGTNANPSTYPGSISDSSGTNGNATALNVSSGSLTLTGANTFGGGATVSIGATLAFTLTSTAGLTGTTYPSAGNTLNNGSLILSDNVTAGNITGSGKTTVATGCSMFVTNLSQAGGLENDGAVEVIAGGTVGPISGNGTLEIDNSLQLAQNSGASSIGLLALFGTLDITNNHFFINYGSAAGGGADPMATIVALINAAAAVDPGTGSPTWSGAGNVITSALLNGTIASDGGSYGIGYADSSDPGNPAGLATGQLEVMFTLLGDANLDGKVNGSDFNILAANFNTGGDSWDQGDFTYDGKVNGSDFNALAANFNQVATLAADEAALKAFAAANGLTANVPEPASLGLVAVATCGMLKRRRKQSSAGHPIG